MQAVILVGGEGTRLRPLTLGTPKPMVPLFGVPFLERTLGRLAKAGVRNAILAAGYLPRAIEEHFGDGSRTGVDITYVVEKEPLGTAGALRNVADLIRGPFFVLNGDVLTTLDLRAMIDFHTSKAGLGTLHAIRVDDPSAFGCILREDKARIASFVEKPPRDEAPTNEINAGTYLLERAVLDWIPPGRNVSIERETFPKLLADGRALYSYVTRDYWLDVGRPEQYLLAHDDILDGLLPEISSDLESEPGTSYKRGGAGIPANILAPSFIGRDVVIDPSARVGPYAVIGAGTRVHARAVVRNSVLWNDVSVGADSQIERAIIASGATIGAAAVLEPGAVVGHDAVISAGAFLDANARVAGPGDAAAVTAPNR